MSVAETMRAKLTRAFDPAELQIVDDSHAHVGHAGHDGTGESHFTVTIVSDAFAGLGRVARHQRVYAVLAEELAGRVHALALVTKTPAEAAGS